MSRKPKPLVSPLEIVAFVALLIVLQFAAAWLFPSWQGARDPLVILGTAAIAGAVYFGLMWLVRSSQRSRKANRDERYRR